MLKHLPPPNPGPRPGRAVRPQQPLNVSALSAASLGSVVGSTPTSAQSHQLPLPLPPINHLKTPLANGGPRLSSSMLNTPLTSVSSSTNLLEKPEKKVTGAKEALTSLGLLCLVSLLLALLSLIFLLKISPGGRELPPGPTLGDDYTLVYDVTLALCALSLSLNLCCLLVCAIQFLFAVKLVKAATEGGRGNKYLQKSSLSRACAVGGFFISIPIFLTGIILYTFTQFHSTPAIITSILIGLGIVFCGAAIVHNVFVWQKEKTICVRKSAAAAAMSASTVSASGLLGNQSLLTPITPPMQFLNHHISNNNNNHNNSTANHVSTPTSGSNTTNLLHLNHVHHMNGGLPNGNANHTPLTHTPVTPLSGNHSHLSFNNHASILASYGLRPAATTPPPLKMGNGTSVSNLMGGGGRDATGSVSPGNLDISTATTSNSQHELSTLV